MAFDIIYKGQQTGQQVDFQTGSLTDISTFDTDVRASAIENQIVDGVTDRGASQDALIAMSGYLASSAHPVVAAAPDTGLDLSDGSVIQDISFAFDGSGHVTDATFTSVDLDDRYVQTGTHNTDITNLDARITAATGDIATNASNISTNASNISTNTTNIGTNTTNIGTNTTNISNNKGYIDTVSGNADTNSTNISQNASDIISLSGLIDSVEAYDLQSITDNGSFSTNDIEVSGLRISGDGSSATITGPATLILDPDSTGPAGTVVIQGDLDVKGTTTTISSTEVQVGDLNLTLGTGAASLQALDGGGLQLSGTAGTAAEFVYTNNGSVSGWTTNGLDIIADLAGNASTATKLESQIGITFAGGDVTGKISNFDGSAEVTSVNLTIAPNSITSGMISDGNVNNSKLENSSVNYGGVTLSLGGSDLTPAFNLVDATGYDAADLVGDIAHSQIAADIPNASLENDSITINAGNGLSSSSGEVALGGSITLNVNAGNGITVSADSISVDAVASQFGFSSNELYIIPNAITSAELGDGAVDSGAIQTDAVGPIHLHDSIAGDNLTITNGVLSVADADIRAGITGSASTIVGDTLAANSVLVSDSNGKVVASSTISSSELSALDNISSNIQGQLNNKVPTSRNITTNNGISGGGDLSADRTLATVADQSHLNSIELGTDNTALSVATTKGGILILRGSAENAITTDGTTGNTIDLANDSTAAFDGIVQIVDTSQADSEDGEYTAMWKINGSIRRDGGGNVTMLSSFATKVWGGSNTSDYAISIGASSDGLQINGNNLSSTFGSGVITSATLTYNVVIES